MGNGKCLHEQIPDEDENLGKKTVTFHMANGMCLHEQIPDENVGQKLRYLTVVGMSSPVYM